MKLKWINLGITNPVWYYSTWEYSKDNKIDEPIIYSMRMNEPTLDIYGNDSKFEEFIDMTNNKYNLQRLDIKNKKSTGVFLSVVIF